MAEHVCILGCGGRWYGRVEANPLEVTEQAYLILMERARAEREFLFATLHRLAKDQTLPVKFVAGEAKGADTGIKIFAKTRGYGYEGFKADWRGLGGAAGIIRNKQMYDQTKPRIVVGFCGDAGTSHMINYARKMQCQHVLHYNDADIDNFMASEEFKP